MNTPQPAGPRLQGLDVLRAVAITFVLFFHYSIFFEHPSSLPRWTSFGWTGVDLFFVLSGFLITSQLLKAASREGIQLKTYFIKRSFRILPLFWLILAVYFLVPSWHEIEGLAPLWKYLTFTQNLYFDAFRHRTFSHAWSLCVEEQFYLVLPFLLLALGRRQTLRGTLFTSLTVMVLGVALRWFSWEHFVATQSSPEAAQGLSWSLGWARWIYYCTQTRLDGLIVGVSIASLFHFRPDVGAWILRRPWQFLLLGVAGLLWAASFSTPFFNHACAIWGYPLIAVSYGCILMAAISPRVEMPGAWFFPFKWMATLSYGVYLSHKMVGHVLQSTLARAGFDAKGWPMLFACLVGMVATGVVLHWLVERPAFALRDLLLKRMARARVVKAPAVSQAAIETV